MVINSKAHKYPIYGGKNILRPMMKIYDGNSKMPIDQNAPKHRYNSSLDPTPNH